MVKIGFSLTNFYFWPNRRLNFLLSNLVKALPQAKAIELSHFWTIKDFLKNQQYLKQYSYRSFHLPKTNLLKWINDLNKVQHQLLIDYLILHPDVVKDWTKIKSKIPLVIENMDNQKKSFQTIKEMKNRLTKNQNLKLCLDVNHLKTINPKDAPAHWLEKFPKKIAEIHLSAIDRGYYQKWLGPNVYHSLCLFDRQILKDFKIKKYPIILEGIIPPQRWDLVKKEFKLVADHLKNERL